MKTRFLLSLIVFFILNFGALAIGVLFTGPGVPSDWYVNLITYEFYQKTWLNVQENRSNKFNLTEMETINKGKNQVKIGRRESKSLQKALEELEFLQEFDLLDLIDTRHNEISNFSRLNIRGS